MRRKGVRKTISCVLSLLTAAALLAGCGSAGTTDTPEDSQENTATQNDASQSDAAQSDVSQASDDAAQEQAASQSSAGGERVTITFSLWDEIQSVVYQEIIDKFEEQNPDIHVEMQITP